MKHPALQGPPDLVADELDLATGVPSQPRPDFLHWRSAIQEEDLRCYPKASRLESRYAEHLGLAKECVLATCGSDDAIDRICREYLRPGDRALWTAPGFSMFPRFVKLCEAKLDEVAWQSGPFPRQTFQRAIVPETRLLILVSPQNPTGQCIDVESIEALAHDNPNCLLLVDQAYAEFSEKAALCASRGLANVIITRSLSKAWGGAGLRVGFAIGKKDSIERLRARGLPFPISGPSIRFALRLLDEADNSRTRYVDAVHKERERLCVLAQGLGLEALPSQSNSVLLAGSQTPWLSQALASLSIATRRWEQDPTMSDFVRVGCPGNAEDFKRLDHAMRCALAPELLLLDMDGVIFDVSSSYRRAIQACTESFGVHSTLEDIEALKLQGRANDDWELSHRLLAKAGVEVSYQQVVERFESIYQDRPQRDGLWRQESLLIPPELLTKLARGRKLGIVTGRPRRDAEQSLRHHGISKAFDLLVCREDAPLKPDPAPIQLALSKLGARHAWYVGDTPDDVIAARRAEVIPIGHLAPGTCSNKVIPTLLKNGASRVIRSLHELLEILS